MLGRMLAWAGAWPDEDTFPLVELLGTLQHTPKVVGLLGVVGGYLMYRLLTAS